MVKGDGIKSIALRICIAHPSSTCSYHLNDFILSYLCTGHYGCKLTSGTKGKDKNGSYSFSRHQAANRSLHDQFLCCGV